MNWQAQRSNRKAIGLTAAASAAIAALGLVPATAQAQGADNATVTNGASVTLLTPFPGTAFSGSKQIEISAFYQDASASGGITTVEISIDGQSAAVKKLDRPELRGVVSFLIDPTTLDLGSHQILIKVSSLSGEHSSVRTSIRYNGDDSSKPQALPSMDSVTSAAGIMVLSPRPSDHVSGIVTIKVNAIDPTGRAPYVSVFIDKVFKSLRNHPPYTFDWDTTRTTNGWHTIEVSGFNDDEQLGKAEPVRVYVNNGGGDTTIDRALTDTPAPQMSKSTPAAEPAANVVSADDARLAKTTPETPAIAATAPAKLASASVDDGTLTDQILLSAPFLQKKTIPAPETTISSSTATLARPREQAPSVIIRSIEPLATVTDPGAIAATPSLTAPAVARIKKQAASAPAPAAGSAELVRTQPVAASPAFTQPNITPVAPVSSGLTGAQAVAPVVSAKPIEASAPSAPAELAAGTRPDAAVTYSSPKMSVSTAEAAVSPDAHAVAPVVSVKPIEASAPSAPAELAAGTRPDAAVTYSSPKMSVSTAEAAVSPDAHAVA
ncbi:MAG: Ig-like domain-containing protein, partial [Capsulimonadaceae bacterium]|nr:Ig-like domain-containing protein [Capsulimonadaceae bacterium]